MAVVAKSPKCAARGCKHTVRPDYAFAPFCYDHKVLSSTYQDAIQYVRDPEHRKLVTPPAGIAAQDEVSASLFVARGDMFSGTAPDVASALPLAIAEYAAGADMTIPNTAAQRSSSAPEELRDALMRHGIDGRRMSKVLHLRGMNRVVLRAEAPAVVQSHPDFGYRVLVVDQGTRNEVVADPTVSMFAPMYDTSAPVETEFPSGSTGFADFPWVGTIDEYVSDAMLWWSDAALGDI